MKKRIIAIVLVFCLFAALASTVGAAEPKLEDCIDLDQLVFHTTSLCRFLEAGNRDNSVVNTSMGCVGMGYMGWVGSSALQLLKWCATPSKGGDPNYCRAVLGDKLYSEVVNAPVAVESTLMPAWAYWRYRVFTDEEIAAAKALLGSKLGVHIQCELARNYILRYAKHGWQAGVRTEPALIYYCSAENHYGESGVKGFMRAVRNALGLQSNELILSLDQFHRGTELGAAAGTISTLSYRRKVYVYITKTLQLSPGPETTSGTPSTPDVTVTPTDPAPVESPEEPSEPLPEGIPFTDLPKSDHWAYDAIIWAYTHDPQITAGTSDTTFSPDSVLTRAEAMTFLWAAAGRPEPNEDSNRFTDVKRKSWFRTAVLWGLEQGYTDGTSENTFSPRRSVTTGEMLTFLYALAERPDYAIDTNPFSDVSEKKYFYDPVLWAYSNNILVGNEGVGDTFLPYTPCTRAYVVTYLYNYFANEAD